MDYIKAHGNEHDWKSLDISLLIRAFISSLTKESVKGLWPCWQQMIVNGLSPRWGSAPACKRARTADLSLLNAAYKRGEHWCLFNRFTLHPAPMKTGTTAGFHMEAQCKGDLCQLSRASTLAPAWTRVFTTVAELLNQAARCRGVTWVGNRVEKQIKNNWSSSRQYMICLKRILVLIQPISFSF